MKGFKESLELMESIMLSKNHDYAGKDADPFSNFSYCEKLGICSVEEGILVRMSDKMTRIANLLKQDAKVVDEKITDTLVDLANYSIILKCYIESKK
jgi:hypothetical protein